MVLYWDSPNGNESASPGYSGPLPNLLAHQPPVLTPANTLLQSGDAAALHGWILKTNVGGCG
jgi:hypothetical protein